MAALFIELVYVVIDVQKGEHQSIRCIIIMQGRR